MSASHKMTLSMSSLLNDSWATNGSLGFFIESATVPQAISMYSTRWWLTIAQAESGIFPRRLNAAKVGAWVAPIAYGSSTSDGNSAQLPAMERINDAVEILVSMQVPIDDAAVVRALESLRIGSMNGAAPGSRGDWGDTAIALATYSSLDLGWPAEVSEKVSSQFEYAIDDQKASDLLSYTIPLLSLLSGQAVDYYRKQLLGEMSWIYAQLPSLPALGRVAAAASLKPLVKELGLSGSE